MLDYHRKTEPKVMNTTSTNQHRKILAKAMMGDPVAIDGAVIRLIEVCRDGVWEQTEFESSIRLASNEACIVFDLHIKHPISAARAYGAINGDRYLIAEFTQLPRMQSGDRASVNIHFT